MADKINECPWEEIESFYNWSEFNDFITWMNENITKGIATKTTVTKWYNGAESFKEEWFLHVDSKTVWRLVWPEPPFAGLFEQVID